MRDALKPTVRNLDRDETEYSHPAYAKLIVSRVSGSAFLYGADYEVGDYLSVRIVTSKARRGLSRFWHTDENEVVEVLVSSAQWAAFVSSMNVGTGVCATMRSRDGKAIPFILPDSDEKELHKQEVDQSMKDAHAALDEIDAAIDSMKISASAKRDLAFKVERARRSVGSTHTFLRRSFGEFVEQKTEKMKANLHAYAESVLMGLGLKAAHAQIEKATETPRIEYDADPGPSSS